MAGGGHPTRARDKQSRTSCAGYGGHPTRARDKQSRTSCAGYGGRLNLRPIITTIAVNQQNRKEHTRWSEAT